MKPITANHHVMVAAAVAALLINTAVAGCSTPRADAAPPLDAPRGGPECAEGPAGAAAPIAVTVALVAMTTVANAIDAGGVVQARTTATITARILAPVREVRLSPGDRVRAGQTLIVLDGDDLAAGARAARAAALAAAQGSNAAAAEFQAARAGLVLARASHDRIAGLQARRSATAQELDEAIATLRSAEARAAAASARASQAASAVESARAAGDQAARTYAFTTITAPFDGMVTEKLIEPGNMASPGTPLLRLEDTREFRLEIRMDESRITQVRNGDSVPVFLGSETTSITGKVVEVSRAVDAGARAFLVKIALPDAPGLRSGEFGKARFTATPRRALTIPPTAIVRRGQLTSVFVVENGVAAVRLVNVDGSEVLAGLSESEVVILAPPAGVADGRRVITGGR
jgi:multidrug resistance efflux pump